MGGLSIEAAVAGLECLAAVYVPHKTIKKMLLRINCCWDAGC